MKWRGSIIPVLLVWLTLSAGCSAKVETTGTESVYLKAENGDMGAVGAAIRQGFDVNKPDESGKTLLHHAIQANQPQVAEMLIEDFRAKADLPDVQGQTAKDYAAQLNNPQITSVLQDAE